MCLLVLQSMCPHTDAVFRFFSFVSCKINVVFLWELPKDTPSYLHMAGRTGHVRVCVCVCVCVCVRVRVRVRVCEVKVLVTAGATRLAPYARTQNHSMRS
jgi:hypothetical protein